MTPGVPGTFAAAWLALALGGAPVAAEPVRPAAQAPTLSQGLTHRSVFDGYQAYAEPALRTWREANDEVSRIGGWKAYAQEAGPADASATPPPPATGAHSAHQGGHTP